MSDTIAHPSTPAVEEHPFVIELEKWAVDEATRQARQNAYQAKVDAALKDVLAEYKKRWADNEEALEEWLNSGEENEGPDC
ncbi:uncharacterized protein ARMOST_01913 [Armillaria ostoyae]|uniref:Uncharacterized protein n=1 Tax=Armillaria ostoyae TaxID=47428 RepID=A0A284QQ98_ARMOS|nr:uncharacterized protein ARMOST_01913 [Armillaria ostoyae]